MYQSFIPFYGWISFHCMDRPHFIYLFISWLTFELFWLLRIMLLWTFVYKFLCRCMFLFLLDIYLGVELLDHRITLYLTIWGLVRLFSKVAAPFYIATSSVLLHILANTCFYLLIVAVLVDVKWYLFLDEEWHWASFHALTVHLYIFFGEMSIQLVFKLGLLNWDVCFHIIIVL